MKRTVGMILVIVSFLVAACDEETPTTEVENMPVYCTGKMDSPGCVMPEEDVLYEDEEPETTGSPPEIPPCPPAGNNYPPQNAGVNCSENQDPARVCIVQYNLYEFYADPQYPAETMYLECLFDCLKPGEPDVEIVPGAPLEFSLTCLPAD